MVRRRRLLRNAGRLTAGIGLLSGIAGAASNDEIGPDDLHSDDKHTFEVEKWESNDTMSETFSQSPCYIAEKVSDGFLVYYAVEEIGKRV